jgi:hypothetical protein
MIRRSVLSPAGVLAGVAATMLVLTGCKVQVPTAAQASGSSTAVQAASGSGAGSGSGGVSRAGSLIVEPGAGFSPVYSIIGGAKHSIDVTMYEFADTTAEQDLAAAAKRGVSVHVILDQREKSENSRAYSYFGSHGVKVAWSSTRP